MHNIHKVLLHIMPFNQLPKLQNGFWKKLHCGFLLVEWSPSIYLHTNQQQIKWNHRQASPWATVTALPILQDMPWLYLLLHVPLCDTVYASTNKILYRAWQYCQTNTSLYRLAVLWVVFPNFYINQSTKISQKTHSYYY